MSETPSAMRLRELRDQIERDDYAVDPAAVAEALVDRMDAITHGLLFGVIARARSPEGDRTSP